VTLEGPPPLSGAPRDFLDASRVVYLATVQPDGSPHLAPISPVIDLDRIVFATERDTAKVRNLEANGSVWLAADRYDEDWSKLRAVIAVGEAQIIEAGFEWERARTLLYEKYPQYPTEAPITEGSTVIVDVRVDRVITWGF
jgi:nitroimidazol reductase NimA-like FMN-containing flavoprotein (pyridoxamine 5'-phosphate oxidase superfamily)